MKKVFDKIFGRFVSQGKMRSLIMDEMLRPVCPECVQGKCGNCDGTAWNDELDDLDLCYHGCHDEEDVE
jgi:hypothetical protein